MAYIHVTKLKNLILHCHKILPLVYDESLSYYETLCKLAELCNETIDVVNTLNDNNEDMNNRIIDINNRLITIESEIDDFEAKIDAEIDGKLAQVDIKLAEVDAKVDDALAQLANAEGALQIYIDRELSALESELKAIINQQLADIQRQLDEYEYSTNIYIDAKLQTIIDRIPEITSVIVVNPVTGTQTSIQQAIDDLFMNTRYNALNLDEVRHLNLTINECNTLMANSIPRGWTIIEWLTKAKDWFNKSPKHLMFNPLNGAIDYYKKIVEIGYDMNRIAGCFNMSELSGLNMSIDDFNSRSATCEQLAWRSNRVLI